MNKEGGSIFQEVDILQVIKRIGTLNKRTQAKLLQELEQHFDTKTTDFRNIRKFVLDELNGLTRAIVREIFGDIEYMIK